MHTRCDLTLNNSHSVKVPAGEHPDLSIFSHNQAHFADNIDSFELCTEELGGDRTHVTLKSGLGNSTEKSIKQA